MHNQYWQQSAIRRTRVAIEMSAHSERPWLLESTVPPKVASFLLCNVEHFVSLNHQFCSLNRERIGEFSVCSLFVVDFRLAWTVWNQRPYLEKYNSQFSIHRMNARDDKWCRLCDVRRSYLILSAVLSVSQSLRNLNFLSNWKWNARELVVLSK